MTWYILKVKSKMELYVINTIKKLNINGVIDVLIPTDDIKSNKGKSRLIYLYPGYVFVNLSGVEVIEKLKFVPYIFNVVSSNGIYNHISNDAIKNMYLSADVLQKKISIGSSVRIVSGPFIDTCGLVESIDNNIGIVTIKVPVLGRYTILEIKLSDVEFTSSQYV